MNRLLATSILVILSFSASIGLGVVGVNAAQNPSSQASTQPAPQQSGMQDMMKMHEKMMADMKAAEAKLDALVMTMNSASAAAKPDAIAAVVNEMVRQQKAMHEHMAQMHQHMMGMGGMMKK